MEFLKIISSILVCGSGQLFNREYFRGPLLFAGFISSVALAYFGFFSDGIMAVLLGFVGVLCSIFFWSYGVIDILEHNEIKKKKTEINDDWDKEYLNGITFYLRGQYDNALEAFHLIIKKNKNDADVYFHLARIYHKKGDSKQAKNMCRRYLMFEHENKWYDEVRIILESQ